MATPAQELIEAASQPGLPLADLLRKAKVLAVRSGNRDMASWIASELAGYEVKNLPAYRGPFPADARADVFGRGSAIKDFPIAPQGLPDFVRESDLFVILLLSGVAELEDLLDPRNHRPGTRGIASSWPPVSVGLVNEMIQGGMVPQYAGMTIVEAWKPISPSLVRSVLDTVRNRVLDYALSLDAADDPQEAQPSSRGPAVGNYTTIHAATGSNIAIGSTNVHQSQGLPVPQTENELISQLRQIGMPSETLEALLFALAEDRRAAGGQLAEPGPKVNEWIGKIAVLGAKAGGGVGVAAFGGVATQLLLQYFGLLPH